MSRRHAPFAIVGSVLIASLIAAGLVLFARSAQALPPAGEDFLIVQATVDVESRLGQEVINLVGTATIQRSAPRLEGGVEVQDLTIVDLSLEGESLTGDVTISQSSTSASVGEVRSKSAGVDFPASSFIDGFFEADVPASPSSTDPLTLRNETAVHLVPLSGGAEINIHAWPPIGTTFGATMDPCLPLIPVQPAEVCVNSLSVTLLEVSAGNPSYSVAPEGPSGFHPADIYAVASDFTPPPTATSTPVNGGPTPTPTPVQTNVSGNDDFADAHVVPSVPFIGQQSTDGMTTETGEPVNPDDPNSIANCIVSQPGDKGATVWYSYTPSSTSAIEITTEDSTYDTVLNVYTGTAFANLQVEACNDDFNEAPVFLGLQSRVAFTASAGTKYHIQVASYRSLAGGGDPEPITGDLKLAISPTGGAGEPAGGFETDARITCTALGLTADGCDDGTDGTQDSIDGLSYGSDFTPNERDIAFSVAPDSLGLGTTAVAAQAACSPPQPQADQFATQLDGDNILVSDGDGLSGVCPTASTLGLIEEPTSDDLDAVTDQPPSAVDPDGDGTPDEAVFFSLDPDSPSLATLGAGPADILYSEDGNAPLVFASATVLGLQAGDDVDAFCLADVGDPLVFSAASDTLYFSLAAGSPTLADLGLSAADVLRPGATVVHEAGVLGLRDEDDLDALDCFVEPPPTPTPTQTSPPTETPTPTPPPGGGDVNKDGSTTAVDATIVLQFVAGFLVTINADGDVNQDGDFTSVDATIILQFVAGFIDELPV